MAIKWETIESNETYQDFSAKEKFDAKKRYWDTQVVENRNFNLQPKHKQEQLKSNFFGGALTEDLQDLSTTDIRFKMVKDTIAETGGVIASSAGKLGSGIIQPVIHPVETVKGLAKLAAGAFEKIIPGTQAHESHFDNLIKVYADRYGSVDALADTVAEDPFGFVSDVYTAAGLAGGIGKAAGAKAPKTFLGAKVESGAFPAHVRNIKSGVAKIRTKTPFKTVEDNLFNAYNKSLAPKGKTVGDTLGIKENVIARSKAIQANLPEEMTNTLTGEKFSVPSNRYENLIGTSNAKVKIWNKVTDLSEGATDAGAKINLNKVAEAALKKTKKTFGDVAVKTDKRNIIVSMQDDIANIKLEFPDGVTPTQAQKYLKTMSKDAIKRRQSGTPIDFDMLEYRTNLYEGLVNNTDDVITKVLDKAGYKKARKEYALIKSGEKLDISAANEFLKQQRGAGGGVSHPIVNLFSVESIGSGIASGQPVQGFVKAGILQTSKKVMDWITSKDRPIKKVYENAKKLNAKEPIQVLNPEVITKNPAIRLAAPKGKRIKPTGLNEVGNGVITIEDPIKRLTFDPTSTGVRFGPKITGGKQGFTGGFGQFILKEK